MEIEIDRELNKNINMSIFKFDIEDTQKEVNIAAPFRVFISVNDTTFLFIADILFSKNLARFDPRIIFESV